MEKSPDFFFKKYRGLYFLLRCNYDNKLWKNSKIPLYYEKILENALKILYGYDMDATWYCSIIKI